MRPERSLAVAPAPVAATATGLSAGQSVGRRRFRGRRRSDRREVGQERVEVGGGAGGQASGVASPGDPVRVAIGVWTALHGIVSLRAALPDFPWPPLAGQIDDVLAGLAGLRSDAAGPV